MHAGAVKGSRDEGVEIIWKGPVREDDRDEQIKVIETFVSQRVAGIVVAPLDSRALMPALNEAQARGIPVAIFDSGTEWKDDISFIATDNTQGGRLGGERLGTLLGGKGRVMMMRFSEGSASTGEREAGFLAVMTEKFPAIEIVSSNQYGGVTTESGYATAEKLLAAHRNVDGIFCPNESTTFGMMLALDAVKLAGKTRLVGFDATPKLIEGLENGKIHGLVVQNPFAMGELGVKTMMKHLRGEPVQKRVDTGVTIVTPANLDSAAIKDLVSPPVARYLKEP